MARIEQSDVARIEQSGVARIAKDKQTIAIEEEVKAASLQWVANFNKKDIRACADAYLEDAVMHVRPMSDFKGRESIYAFWNDFVTNKKAADLVFTDVQVSLNDDKTVGTVTAKWTMNVGGGTINGEQWVKQSDGRWLLAVDDFTVEHSKLQ